MIDLTFEALEAKWARISNLLGPEWKARGRMGRDAFFAYLEHFPTVADEFIPIQRNPDTGKIEILFLKRSDNDPFPEYAGRYHTPGGMMIPGATFQDTLKRVIEQELGCEVKEIHRTRWNGELTPRGYEHSLPTLIVLLGTPKKGWWISISAIAQMAEQDAIITAQYHSFIKQAVEWLQSHNNVLP